LPSGLAGGWEHKSLVYSAFEGEGEAWEELLLTFPVSRVRRGLVTRVSCGLPYSFGAVVGHRQKEERTGGMATPNPIVSRIKGFLKLFKNPCQIHGHRAAMARRYCGSLARQECAMEFLNKVVKGRDEMEMMESFVNLSPFLSSAGVM